MRTVALDVHKRFAEVAVHEDGALRRLGRIETAQLRVFAQSLGPQDHVVLESTAVTRFPSPRQLVELADELPGGHEASIASTLMRSIAQLDEAGLDFCVLPRSSRPSRSRSACS